MIWRLRSEGSRHRVLGVNKEEQESSSACKWVCSNGEPRFHSWEKLRYCLNELTLFLKNAFSAALRNVPENSRVFHISCKIRRREMV